MNASTCARGTTGAARGWSARAPSDGLASRAFALATALAGALRGLPWLRAAAKGAGVLGLLAALAWFGARHRLEPLPAAAGLPGAAVSAAVAAVGASSAAAEVALPAAKGDAAVALEEPEGGVAPGAGGVLPDGRVVLNAATEEDLCKLPRIGPARARQIVALRSKLGRFRSVRDLLRVKGIGPKTLHKLQGLLVLERPPVADAGASG